MASLPVPAASAHVSQIRLRAVPTLTVVRDETAFTRAPIGRCFVHPSFLVWRIAPDLGGLAFWGRPTTDDAHALIRVLHARHASGFRDVATITDTRGLTGLEPETFELMVRYVRERSATDEERLGRSFLLLDPTAASAMVAGVSAALGRLPDLRSAGSYHEALRAIGYMDAPAVAQVLEATVKTARAPRPFLTVLRDYLERHLANASVLSAARALGMSPRSFQRALATAGSSFVLELRRARVRDGEELLLRTDWKIEIIAARVGFASVSHFRHVFQEETGVGPSEYRAARTLRRSE